MTTNLQDCSNGIRLTADGAFNDGELFYITAAGKAKATYDVDNNPVGVAASAVSDTAEGLFLPFVPGKQYWIKSAEAIAVGENVFADQTAFKTVSATALDTTQAKRIGVCMVACSSGALVKVLCTQQSS